MIDVSIVIVCMNNLKNLYPCLESIRKYTNEVNYETLVVAYLFSPENLLKVQKDFPWVTFIESNEIRGFSENNNLALRQAKGKYSFVLNDDTEMKMPVLDRLIGTIEALPEKVAIISPVTLYADGSVQCCGRPFTDWKKIVLSDLHLYSEKKDNKQSNQTGIFKSYNIIGAAFLIKTEIFRNVGWFNEYYFFSPEDKALSTLLNKKGYECWVDSSVSIVHYEGMTGKAKAGLSMVQTATRPVMNKGGVYFYSDERTSGMRYNLLCVWYFVHSLMQYIVHSFKSLFKEKPNLDQVLAIGDRRTMATIFSKKTPKEIFIHYFKKLNSYPANFTKY